ncbi:hypothetical protein PHK61_05360 [Actinomycetospora lutea]|uniref:hypothetical protein n=1 Tax=Actinomycetospora lutea TaxID=663604 RepID=UPI002366357D|nr:hypothetical protein [Actinomycetospora lutea]MDD7937848.1 hypothetical protein [Actinomycetospora lutea]
MDNVTLAGTGRHVASWRAVTGTASLIDAVVACEPQGMPKTQRPRVAERDQYLPTFVPQRPSAASRWSP